MSLINWKIDLIVIWSAIGLISTAANQATTFSITHTKPYVPVLTLSTRNSAKLL